MDYFIVAKSRIGWGVALGSDVVQEFENSGAALDHAEQLCAMSVAAGRQAQVIDLTEADLPGSLAARKDQPQA